MNWLAGIETIIRVDEESRLLFLLSVFMDKQMLMCCKGNTNSNKDELE